MNTFQHRGYITPSAIAQNCTADVLNLIFMQLDKRDLAAVALCCRSWSDPAYRNLYRDVRFTPLFPTVSQLSANSAHLLCRTLKRNAGIRLLIRYLSISHRLDFDDDIPFDLYSWIPLLPDNTVRSLSFTCFGNEEEVPMLSLVLDSPVIRTLEEFSFRGQFDDYSSHIPKILGIATLRFLDLNVHAGTEDITIPRSSMPLLRHLRISPGSTEYSPFVKNMIEAIGSPIEQLECFLSQYTNDGLEDLTETILRNAPNLETLLIHAPYVPHPFLDKLVARSPHLQYVYASAGALSIDFFSTLPLPAGVKTLGFQYTLSHLFPEQPFCDALLKTMKNLTKLSRIYFIHGTNRPPDFQYLPSICHDLGVQCDILEREEMTDKLFEHEYW